MESVSKHLSREREKYLKMISQGKTYGSTVCQFNCTNKDYKTNDIMMAYHKCIRECVESKGAACTADQARIGR